MKKVGILALLLWNTSGCTDEHDLRIPSELQGKKWTYSLSINTLGGVTQGQRQFLSGSIDVFISSNNIEISYDNAFSNSVYNAGYGDSRDTLLMDSPVQTINSLANLQNSLDQKTPFSLWSKEYSPSSGEDNLVIGVKNEIQLIRYAISLVNMNVEYHDPDGTKAMRSVSIHLYIFYDKVKDETVIQILRQVDVPNVVSRHVFNTVVSEDTSIYLYSSLE